MQLPAKPLRSVFVNPDEFDRMRSAIKALTVTNPAWAQTAVFANENIRPGLIKFVDPSGKTSWFYTSNPTRTLSRVH